MRESPCFIRAAVFLVILSPSAFAQDLPLSLEAFEAASPKAKLNVLAGIAMHSVQLPAEDTIALVKAGLLEPDRDVRRQALMAVASRSAGPLFSGGDSKPRQERIREEWWSENALIAELRPHVLTALGDPDPEVRLDAVKALASMDFDIRERELKLKAQTVDDFAAHYARETKGYVRAEIVKSFALISQDSPRIRQVLLSALNDPDIWVRRYALDGSKRLRLSEALPKAVEALSDTDWEVRFKGVRVLNALGVQAASHVEALEEMLASETNEIVRGEIERTLSKIRKAK